MRHGGRRLASGTIRVRRVRGAMEWERCRVEKGDMIFFHRWDWLSLMAPVLNSRFLPLGLYQSSTLLGLAPLLIKQFGPYKSANWVPFPYLGPMVPGALLPGALRALDEYQRRNGIGLIQLSFPPGADVDVRALVEAGYAVHEDTTMILHLAGRDEQEVWAGLRPRGRKSVRQAERAGVQVTMATEHDIAQELPAIVREAFAARGQPLTYPPMSAQAVWDRYHGSANVRMTAARYTGDTAAVKVTLIDGARATLWEGGGRRQYRSVNPNSLLYWDAIRWARDRGCRTIDFVGNPDEAIARFKASFGATEMPYIVASRANSLLAAWGRSAHSHAGLIAHGLRQRLSAGQPDTSAARE